MNDKRWRCVLIGSEATLRVCAEKLLDHGHQICCVATRDDSVAAWAEGRGIPTVEDPRDLAEVDYLFSIANLQVVSPDVLKLARRGAINFHDGLLPRYSGLNTPAWALMEGATRYAVTWHFMSDEVDRGEILLEEEVPLEAGETTWTLNTKCLEAAIASFEVLLTGLENGTIKPYPQAEGERRLFRRTQRPAAGCVLRWSSTAEDLDRLVRALTYGPYANPLGIAKILVGDRAVLVRRARLAATASDKPSGTVLAAGPSLVVATPTCDFEILEVAALDGTDYVIPKLVKDCAIQVGSRLEVLDGEGAEALTRSVRPAAQHEAAWIERLGTLAWPEAPVPGPTVPAPPATTAPREVAFSDLSAPDAGPSTVAIAALCLFVARLTGQPTFDIALRDRRLRRLAADSRGLLSDWVPVRFQYDSGATVAQHVLKIDQDLEIIESRFAFLRDVFARTPHLSPVQDAIDGRPAIGVELEADVDACTDLAADLVLRVARDGRPLGLRFDPSRVDPEGLKHFARRVHEFYRVTVRDPETVVSSVPLMSADEADQVMGLWNDTNVAFDRDATIHGMFQEQIRRAPDQTAVICGDDRLTYSELGRRAKQLAGVLRSVGVGDESRVGICMERSVDLMVAVLGVLEAGAAYVPLDPTYPAKRLEYMATDAGLSALIAPSHLAEGIPVDVPTVSVEGDGANPAAETTVSVCPDQLAYVIYTSGSTGKPKGVMVEHRNVVNFFRGMDDRINVQGPVTWLAVTSLSFDISVLELLWPITRGHTVVIHAGTSGSMPDGRVASASSRRVAFSLFYFAADEGADADPYRLLKEGARFADEHGFEAVWTPERHFHAFGGLYPNPAVAGAALATLTKRVGIRAGSCVLPLHHPVRVAEEWSLVDNLSNGRVGVSFASGWQPNDFLLKPENFPRAKEVMSEQIDVVRQLWRGETVTFEGPKGPVDVQTHPRPVQSELPVWITTAGNPATFELAGHKGAFILTHLLGQNIEELGEKLAAYRRAWREAGHEGDGHVTLMLHTFVDDDAERVRKVVHEPLKRYLSTSANLIKQFASTFPAFKHVNGVSGSIDRAFEELSEEDMDALLDHAVLRYEETSGLFGTPAACIAMVDRLKSIEVDEIACLIDFGIATDDVLGSLPALERLKTMSNERPAVSIPEEIRRHGVTHFQCTPSQAGMLLADPEAVDALGSLRQMLAGGERLPSGIADKLWKATKGRLLNVYGPTETTIWSTTHPVQKGEDPVSIGRPIANTRLYVLSATRDAVPPGMVGELYIGGEGVTRGYLNRPEQTAERFVPDPFANGSGDRLYRTGDVVRYRSDGDLEFVGRLDDQVKLGGYRIELGEIASALQEHESVREAVAVVRHDGPTGADLVAYIVPRTGNGTDAPALAAFLRDRLPASMLPSTIHKLAALPLTPNNKIDRKALPSPWTVRPREIADVVPALSNGVQATIAQIWEAVLNRQGIDHDASFFDLGGRSLLALEVQRRLEKHFARRVPLTVLFRHPTISSLATHFASEPASAESVGTQRAAQRKAARRRARGE